MGLTAPEINYLFQEMLKDTPLVVPALIFEVKIAPSPPLRTAHRAAIRKIFYEKDARDNGDFKTGSENVLAIMVRPQIKK